MPSLVRAVRSAAAPFSVMSPTATATGSRRAARMPRRARRATSASGWCAVA